MISRPGVVAKIALGSEVGGWLTRQCASAIPKTSSAAVLARGRSGCAEQAPEARASSVIPRRRLQQHGSRTGASPHGRVPERLEQPRASRRARENPHRKCGSRSAWTCPSRIHHDTLGCMNERRRPPRRGRGPRPAQPRPTLEANDMEVNPYRDDMSPPPENDGGATDNGAPSANIPQPSPPRPVGRERDDPRRAARATSGLASAPSRRTRPLRPERTTRAPRTRARSASRARSERTRPGGHRRRRGSRGLVRRRRVTAGSSDAPPRVTSRLRAMRSSLRISSGRLGLRRGDTVQATVGRDHRGRMVVAEVKSINGAGPGRRARAAPSSPRSSHRIPSASWCSRRASRRRADPSSRAARSISSRRSATASAR